MQHINKVGVVTRENIHKLYNAQRATQFTRLEESIQGFYISEEQKFKTILSDGNNVRMCKLS